MIPLISRKFPLSVEIATRLISRKNAYFLYFQYGSIPEFLADLRKMFRNCLKFHENGSEFYSHGKSLEEILDKFLEQWLPEYAYESFEKEDFTKYKPQPSTSTGKKRKNPADVHEEIAIAKKKHKKSKKGKKSKKHKKRGRHAKEDLEEDDVDSEMDGSFESEDSELSTGEQLDVLGKLWKNREVFSHCKNIA